MIYNNYNIVQNIYERRAAGGRIERFSFRECLIAIAIVATLNRYICSITPEQDIWQRKESRIIKERSILCPKAARL